VVDHVNKEMDRLHAQDRLLCISIIKPAAAAAAAAAVFMSAGGANHVGVWS
jgi:hypothetical protein